MKATKALKTLQALDQQGYYVFNKHDLAKLFPDDNTKSLDEGLHRLTKAGILKHACRGIYINPYASSLNSFILEQIAKTLRKGKYNYISLESILSEYGLISQIPIDRLTIMTTGRSGLYQTDYGVIEFTHTKRSIKDILQHTQAVPQRPLRIATAKAAVRDLKRVGRNIKLLQLEDNNNE